MESKRDAILLLIGGVVEAKDSPEALSEKEVACRPGPGPLVWASNQMTRWAPAARNVPAGKTQALEKVAAGPSVISKLPKSTMLPPAL